MTGFSTLSILGSVKSHRKVEHWDEIQPCCPQLVKICVRLGVKKCEKQLHQVRQAPKKGENKNALLQSSMGNQNFFKSIAIIKQI